MLGRSAIRAVQKVDLGKASATASCHCVLQTLPQGICSMALTGQTPRTAASLSKRAELCGQAKSGRAGSPIASIIDTALVKSAFREWRCQPSRPNAAQSGPLASPDDHCCGPYFANRAWCDGVGQIYTPARNPLWILDCSPDASNIALRNQRNSTMRRKGGAETQTRASPTRI